MKGGNIKRKMVEIELLSKGYLNKNTCSDGDIVEIVGEAVYGTLTDKRTQQTKKVLNIPVKCNNNELIYTPGAKTITQLVTTFGKQTKDWIGKKFQVKVVTIEAFGKEQEVIRVSFM